MPRPRLERAAALDDAHGQPEYFVQFSLRNACVAFYDEKSGMDHAYFISRQGVNAVAHGFSEYVYGYQRITWVRPEKRHEAERLARCDVRPLAIGVPFSCNNVR